MKRNVYWGVFLIAIAAVLLFSQTGLIDADFNIWNLLFGGIFVGMIFDGVKNKNFPEIFFGMAFLWIVFGRMIGFPYVSPWNLLVIAGLFSAGFSFLFPTKKKSDKNISWDDEIVDETSERNYNEHVEASQDSYVTNKNSFGAASKFVTTKNLKGAKIENVFGETKVYFDNAMILEDPVTLVVENSFGCVVLYVPREWNVVHNVSVFAASVTEKNQSVTQGRPVVNLTGNVAFGAIEIIYV